MQLWPRARRQFFQQQEMAMARRYVPYEICLIAFTEHPDGMLSVVDIIETSFHYASHFWGRFRRLYPEVKYVEFRLPGASSGRRVAI
jgi:hypothetical protein